MKSEFGSKISKGFPPKKFIQNLSPHHVDRRHQQLQNWLNYVLSFKDVCSSESLQLFIRQGKEDTDFVPKKRSTIVESDIDVASLLYRYRNNKWKARWFVLRHGILYKYHSSLDKHPTGLLDVRGSFAYQLEEEAKIKPRPFIFCVEEKNLTKNGQPIVRYFAAENEESMKKWIAKINNEVIQSDIYRVFGTPIEHVKDRDINGVPLFLSSLLTFLEATAMDREDLFTQPPDEEIKRQIDRGKLIDVAKVVEDVHAVAGLVIQYLHELPEPVIPLQYHDLFFGIFKLEDEKMRKKMLNHFSEILPIVNRNMLLKLFSFLEKVSNHGVVKIERLIKIFGRLVLRPPQALDNNAISFITKELITNWDCLIVPDEVYEPAEMFVVVKKKKEAVNDTESTTTKESLHTSDIESEDSSEDIYTESDEFVVVHEAADENALSDEKDNEIESPRKKKSKKSSKHSSKKKKSGYKKSRSKHRSKEDRKLKKKSSKKIKRKHSKKDEINKEMKEPKENQDDGESLSEKDEIDKEDETKQSEKEERADISHSNENNEDSADVNIDETSKSNDEMIDKEQDIDDSPKEEIADDKDEGSIDDSQKEDATDIERKKSVKFNIESEEGTNENEEEDEEEQEQENEDAEADLESGDTEKHDKREDAGEEHEEESEDSSDDDDSSQEENIEDTLLVPPKKGHRPLSVKIRPKVRRKHKPTVTRINVEYNRPVSHLSPQQQLIADLTRVLNSSRK